MSSWPNEKELLARAEAQINGPIPDDVFYAIVRNMARIGRRRDRSVCPVCGEPAPPTGAYNDHKNCHQR